MINSICIVDDNEIDVYQVSRVVNKSGLVEHFYSFFDGRDALDHFLNFKESEKKFKDCFPPTVMLLDINMPRMDGFQFLEEFKKLPQNQKNSIVIMMLTSSDQGKDKERASKFSEVIDYFVKPFNKDQLENIFKIVESR